MLRKKFIRRYTFITKKKKIKSRIKKKLKKKNDKEIKSKDIRLKS